MDDFYNELEKNTKRKPKQLKNSQIERMLEDFNETLNEFHEI